MSNSKGSKSAPITAKGPQNGLDNAASDAEDVCDPALRDQARAPSGKQAREARLAEALRANLRRRKS